MKRIFSICLAATCLLILPAVAGIGPSQQLVFDKLVGLWKRQNGRSFELWQKNSDGSFQSSSFRLKGTDTSWTERGRVYPDGDAWIYENVVAGQNDGRAIRFRSIFLTEKTVQFSNPAHDFPTDINYTLRDHDSLHAFIIGPNKTNGRDTIPFDFIRVK